MSVDRQADRRTLYKPSSRQEAFNVPLIGAAVIGAIDAHAAAHSGRRVLDAGCGGQPLRGALEARGYSYTGLDIVAQPGVTLEFELALDAPWPDQVFASGVYDLVLCTEVLEHVHGWSVAWRNLARALKPGGTLIVSCPFFYPLHEVPHDHWRPTEFAIRAAAAEAGLEVVEFRRLGDVWDVLGTLAGAAVPVRGSGLMAAPLTLLARGLRNAAWLACKAGFVRRAVTLRTELYLGNFAIVRKPPGGP